MEDLKDQLDNTRGKIFQDFIDFKAAQEEEQASGLLWLDVD